MASRKKKRKREISAARAIDKPAISLCMIAKNEEGYIERAIQSVREVVDEIFVVDTGSDDRTATAARNLGATVYHHEWNDDFSDARNVSLEHASGAWILVLDADETIAPADARKIPALTEGNPDAYLFTYRSYSNNSNDVRWEINDGSCEKGNGWHGWISGKVVRLFRNEPRIRFRGAVHESVEPSITDSGGTIETADIILHHFHEMKGNETLREKQMQYLRLCEKDLKRNPNNPKTYFDMGLVYGYILKDHRKAISYYENAIRLDHAFEDARIALAFSCYHSGKKEQAAAEISAILTRNPDSAPALLLCGIILEQKGRTERAIQCYERAIRLIRASMR